MATSWSLAWAATAAPDAYLAWLAAFPGYVPNRGTVVDPHRGSISSVLNANFDPVDGEKAEMAEQWFGFRPTHEWYFVDCHGNITTAKLEAYRVAFAFLRDFPDDCLFEQQDSGRFARRDGRLVVNESAFTFNEDFATFLRRPSLLIPYQAAIGNGRDLQHPDWPARPKPDYDE